MRDRLVETLQQRFASPVTLGTLEVHYRGELQVEGGGLRVQSVLHGVAGEAGRPMLRVRSFRFSVGLLSLLTGNPSLHGVHVQGVDLELPPVASQGSGADPKQSVLLSSATFDDAHVTFQTSDPARAPFVFDFPHGELSSIQRGKPLHFDLVVENGPPVGQVRSSGTIGPWNFDDPRQTHVAGSFKFQGRDLSSVHGLLGKLSLDGTYNGTVARMHTQGIADHAGFGLDVSSRTFDLRSKFDMLLDAATGVVQMQAIDAHFANTHFICSGAVTKNRAPEGYNLDLHLDVPAGHVEDALALGARTKPPILRGAFAMQAALKMLAGPEPVSHKLQLSAGTFHVTGATFSNAKVQQTVNDMSERARGNPQDATKALASAASSDVSGEVSLQHAVMRFQRVRLVLPGAQAVVGGTYSLDGTNFALDGSVHTEAQASNMTTGVKRVLAKPFNGLFSHGHKGATLPLTIRGVGDEPHFGVKLPGGAAIAAPAVR